MDLLTAHVVRLSACSIKTFLLSQKEITFTKSFFDVYSFVYNFYERYTSLREKRKWGGKGELRY